MCEISKRVHTLKNELKTIDFLLMIAKEDRNDDAIEAYKDERMGVIEEIHEIEALTGMKFIVDVQ